MISLNNLRQRRERASSHQIGKYLITFLFEISLNVISVSARIQLHVVLLYDFFHLFKIHILVEILLKVIQNSNSNLCSTKCYQSWETVKVSKEFIGYKSSPNSIRSCSVRSSAPDGQKIKVVFFSQKESFPRQCKDILYLYPDEERLLDYCLAKAFSFLLSCTNQIETCH